MWSVRYLCEPLVEPAAWPTSAAASDAACSHALVLNSHWLCALVGLNSRWPGAVVGLISHRRYDRAGRIIILWLHVVFVNRIFFK